MLVRLLVGVYTFNKEKKFTKNKNIFLYLKIFLIRIFGSKVQLF